MFSGGPTVYPNNQTVVSEEGGSATFTAEYCANPSVTRLLWITTDKVFKPGDALHNIIAHNITVIN